MKNNLIQIKFKQRLNKLASQDYDNLECWQISEAFNNAMLKWVRRQIIGLNSTQIGDEGSKNLIDDLQVLIKNIDLTYTPLSNLIESQVIPSDYLYLKRITIYAKTATCTFPKMMVAYLAKEADVPQLLSDFNTQPNFEWGETFYTISGNRLKVYTSGKFIVTKLTLTYYKRPQDIAIVGCADPSTGSTITTERECELKDDVVEIIIDEGVSIIAGDIESFNQYSLADQKIKTST